MMMGVGKFEIYRPGQDAGNSQAGAGTAVHRQNFFLGEMSILPLMPLTDWMRPIQIVKYNLLSLKSADCRH